MWCNVHQVLLTSCHATSNAHAYIRNDVWYQHKDFHEHQLLEGKEV